MVAGAAPVDALVFNQVAHTGPAPFAAITSDGILATAGFDSLVRLWDIDTDELIVEFRSVGGQPQDDPVARWELCPLRRRAFAP